jgi:hypothetical protein
VFVLGSSQLVGYALADGKAEAGCALLEDGLNAFEPGLARGFARSAEVAGHAAQRAHDEDEREDKPWMEDVPPQGRSLLRQRGFKVPYGAHRV